MKFSIDIITIEEEAEIEDVEEFMDAVDNALKPIILDDSPEEEDFENLHPQKKFENQL